jgi:hypothetical protein
MKLTVRLHPYHDRLVGITIAIGGYGIFNDVNLIVDRVIVTYLLYNTS